MNAALFAKVFEIVPLIFEVVFVVPLHVDRHQVLGDSRDCHHHEERVVDKCELTYKTISRRQKPKCYELDDEDNKVDVGLDNCRKSENRHVLFDRWKLEHQDDAVDVAVDMMESNQHERPLVVSPVVGHIDHEPDMD